MALTPPQPDPPRLRQFPAICRNGFLLRWCRPLVGTGLDIDVLWKNSVDQGRQLPTAAVASRSTPCVDEFIRYLTDVPTNGRPPPTAGSNSRVNLSKAGTVGSRGVSRMDAATKPPWMGSRRPREPTVPRHPTECRSGFGRCRCIKQVQGCKPCQTNPLISGQSAIPLGQAARAGAALHTEPYR